MDEYLLVADSNIEGKFVSGVYFHGQLEDDLHYDLVDTIGETLYQRIVSDKEKVIDTYVLVNDVFKPVRMFLWVSELNQKRGLVCYRDDLETISDAIEKQKKCAMWL